MNITIEDGGFTFSRSFEEHPAIEEALFASLYLLTKIYPPSEVKKGLVEVRKISNAKTGSCQSYITLITAVKTFLPRFD